MKTDRRTHSCPEIHKQTNTLQRKATDTHNKALTNLPYLSQAAGRFGLRVLFLLHLFFSHFLLPLTAHDRISPHLALSLPNTMPSNLSRPLPPTARAFNGLIHNLPRLQISASLLRAPHRCLTPKHAQNLSPHLCSSLSV